MRPALLLACSILLGAAPALADPDVTFLERPPPRALRLEYTRGPGTESCPTENGMLLLLVTKFLYNPFTPNAGPRMEISVTRKGVKYHVDITLYDARANLVWAHAMEAQRPCVNLLDDAAFDAHLGAIWKLAEQPEAPPPPKEPAPAPGPVTPPLLPPAAAPPIRVLPPLATTPAPQLTFRFGAGLIGSLGLAPGLSAGGFGFASWHWRDFFSFSGEARVTDSVIPGDERGYLLRGRFIGGAAVPCYHRDRFFLCGALHFGMLEGRIDGSLRMVTEDPFVFAIGARLGAELPFTGRFALHGFAELTDIVTRTHFGRWSAEVWSTPRMCASIGLAFTVR